MKHYEKRLEKLHHLQSEYLVKSDEEKKFKVGEKDVDSLFTDKIKRHERTVEKMHAELETKIVNRHNEL